MQVGIQAKDQGYTTGALGKWHVGLKWRPEDEDPGDFHFGSQLHGPGANKSIAALSQRVDHTVPIEGGPLAIGFDTFFGTPSNCTRIPVFIRGDRVIHNPKRDETGLIRDPALERSTVDESVGKGGSGSGELQSDLLDRSTANRGGDGWHHAAALGSRRRNRPNVAALQPITEDSMSASFRG